jgi:CRISPR/Cas system-associated protein Cas10 (large subunit of type III CRISPR-Cas system)
MSETEKEELNKTYPCPGCKCTFFTKHDLQKHLNAFPSRNHEEEFRTLHKKLEHDDDTEDTHTWYPSKYGDGAELMLSEKDLDLANKLRSLGTVTMGRYRYRLNGKWIIKEKV